MAPGIKVRGQDRAARTRTAILDAAEQLIAERKLEAVRVEDVAAAAGVSAASVYVHFLTKDGLLAAVADRLMQVGMDALSIAFESDAEPFERWAETGVAYLRLLLEHPALLRYIAAAGDRPPTSETDQAIDARFTELRQRFEDQISEAIASGRMVQTDPRGLAFFLMGAWNGVAALVLRHDGLALDRDAIERAVMSAGGALMRGFAVQG